MLDTTLRPICFGQDRDSNKETAKAVGAETFKRYEYMLYVFAQFSRLAYCDPDCIWDILRTYGGQSNDIVNEQITQYNPTPAKHPPLGSYITNHTNFSAFVMKAADLPKGHYNTFLPNDVIVSFSGLQIIDGFLKDLFLPPMLKEFRTLVGDRIPQLGSGLPLGSVPTIFANPLLENLAELEMALQAILTPNARLFVTCHSYGGAFATLFGFLVAETRLFPDVPSVHIVTYGAPCTLTDKARNSFNAHLDSGFLTLDRVVSQAVPTVTTITTTLVHTLTSANDMVPSLPPGLSHPGFRPLIFESNPERKGRPYQLSNIRKYYGVPSTTNYRDSRTWPFSETTMPSPVSLESKENLEEFTQTLPQSGGVSADKLIYDKGTKHHMPNQISVRGPICATTLLFAHAEYMGMFFLGAFVKAPQHGGRTTRKRRHLRSRPQRATRSLH